MTAALGSKRRSAKQVPAMKCSAQQSSNLSGGISAQVPAHYQ